MNYVIEHEIAGRIRFRLDTPTFPPVNPINVEALLSGVQGVTYSRFTPRTRGLLVRYVGDISTRSIIMENLAAALIPATERYSPKPEFIRNKQVVVNSALMLLARPFLPIPVRPIFAFYGAAPVLKRGFISLRRARMDVDLLDASAVSAAMATNDFFAASVIVFLLKLGKYLEEWTKGKSRSLLSDVFHIADEWAWVMKNGEETRLPLAQICEGDVIVARMGCLIPVDGTVLEGDAMVNQSSLTGEGIAVAKHKGSTVYAGTALEEGRLLVIAKKTGANTRVARIVNLIADSGNLKAETQSRGEQLAERVVPYSFLLSALTFLLTGNAARAASVLLVDYSCAIKLSTPLAVLSSIARAAKQRVLIKGGRYLELLASADAFVLDKTGTLTEAAPKVAQIIPLNGYTGDQVLAMTACVEEHFPHPVATAVVRYAADKGLIHGEEHAEVEYVVAHGIATRLDGERVVVGSKHFVHEDEGVDLSPGNMDILRLESKGHSILYLVKGGKLIGLIAIHDPLRADAADFINDLRAEEGIKKIILLTGDNEETARGVATSLAIAEYRSRALPDDKLRLIDSLRSKGYIVAMVGDGVNDSPALARAHVGISMHQGADIAKEACDVLIINGSLENIVKARKTASEGMTLIRENFRLIVSLNTVAMAMAITGATPPLFSAAFHNLATVFVGLRALKPLRIKQTN